AARHRAAGARDRAGRGLPDRVRDLPRRADHRRPPSDDGNVFRQGRGRDVMRSQMTWTRIARDSLVLIGIIAAVVYWVYLTKTGGAPVDVHAYWAADWANLYPHPEAGEKNGFNYSPIFDTLVAPGRILSFDVFVAIWRAILLAALVYLAGPFTIFVLFTVPAASEINAGNIQILLALAIVMGFRYPASWSFVL